MRLLIFNWKDLAHPAAGGAEVFTEEVARQLVVRGHDVTLFCAAVAGRAEHETVAGVRIIRRGSRFGVYRAARRFWRHHGEGQFDVVLDEVNTRPFMTPKYVKTAPVVALIHQVAREVWRYEMPLPVAIAGRYVLEPWWLRTYRDVPTLTDSPSSAESLAAYGLRNVSPIPMGGDGGEVRTTAKDDRPTVVFLGRLVRSKRPDHAIAAFRVLRDRYPDAQMWLIGDGPMRARLERELPSGVELLGHASVEERTERLGRAHVLVATSVREGWGLNVSEAAASGTPTIGYRVPGLVDSVPASGGMVVDPDPQSLGEALADHFSGRLPLRPRVSTKSWAEVADALEQHLTAARTGADPSRRGSPLRE